MARLESPHESDDYCQGGSRGLDVGGRNGIYEAEARIRLLKTGRAMQ
jgi:hypothetical protein